MEQHKFDPLSFGFGLVYALLGLIFLIPNTPIDLVDLAAGSVRWVWPAVILVIAAAILVPLARSRDES